MFGYIVMNKLEIKFKNFDLYRSFYCGLCRELKSKYGISGQISLTYDMTFVVILLSALYEPHTQKGSTRCIIHPVCKQPVRRNTVTEYAADMNVLLTYYKCRDDWEDEKKVTALGYSKVLQGKVKKLDQKYPSYDKVAANVMKKNSEKNADGKETYSLTPVGEYYISFDGQDVLMKDLKSGEYKKLENRYKDYKSKSETTTKAK